MADKKRKAPPVIRVLSSESSDSESSDYDDDDYPEYDYPEIEGFQWTPQHEMAWRYFCEGKSFCLLGSAGTGKTSVLRPMIERRENVVKAASTGIAAVAISGTTFHSAFGIGVDGFESVEYCLDRLSRNGMEKMEMLRQADLIVIDEVSMLPADLIDLMDQILKNITESTERFGGKQVIFSGDCLQLKCIKKDPSGKTAWGNDTEQYMFYHANCWVDVHTVVLNRIFRQADNRFSSLLSQIRVGNFDSRVMSMMNNCTKTFEERGINPPFGVMHVFPRNNDADRHNEEQLQKVQGEEKSFRAVYDGPKNLVDILRKNCRAQPFLTVRVGCVVMLLVNISVGTGLVNGSRGVVVGYEEEVKVPVAKWQRTFKIIVNFGPGLEQVKIGTNQWNVREGHKYASMTQVPLCVAYAMSIHKVQGMTLNYIKVNLERVWELAQVYVALSRATAEDGIMIVAPSLYRITSLRPHPATLAFMEAARQAFMRQQNRVERASARRNSDQPPKRLKIKD